MEAAACARCSRMHPLGLWADKLDRLVQKRLIFNDPARFDAAGRSHDELGLGIVNSGGQFLGGKPAEHHRMHRPNPGTGQHGHPQLPSTMGM